VAFSPRHVTANMGWHCEAECCHVISDYRRLWIGTDRSVTLLGSALQRLKFLYFRAHVLARWRPSRTNHILIWLSSDEVEVEVNLRQTVSRPVCPVVRRPSGTRDQFFFILEISFWQLCIYYFVAPSLTRGRVYNLLYNCFWALPEQSLLGRSPAELRPYFTVSSEWQLSHYSL
jgi:hypothetical protein